jgi:hypothetical protein
VIVVLVAIALVHVAMTESLAKSCDKRPHVRWGWSLYPPKSSRGRGIITIKKTYTVDANNGLKRTLQKGNIFFGCGCDKSNWCVIYGDRTDFKGFRQENDDGSTFFANIPRRIINFKNKKAAKKIRGSFPLKSYKKIVRRNIIATNLRDQGPDGTRSPVFEESWLIHGTTSPLFEYTWLANGKYVTGAVTPASYYEGKTKIGLGYNTGLFRPKKHKFYDVCAPIVTTRARVRGTDLPPWEGPAEVRWVFGYVKVSKKAKVWCWMIEGISMNGRVWGGNVS